ncbi:amidohydrolase family protein [Aldersonia sp. NBC_00410]|uniref:amidohydrolase family protein n=1 Tax=Aldersonia sp. NBC_00410 TaxID=2975954 RepID=UPI0022555C41|nr:amidohydrolase family protein [Aldersonia sp. NBC_00410]MCX5041973.1 amidohydrolase family protein [Aldersonia sp. NBC_00410]
MFDAHLHIIDPRFPLIENDGFLPEPFTIADYQSRMSGFGVDGGAVVAGSFQGTDQSFLVSALRQLGPGWVGVTQLDVDATDDDIISLDRLGVRAVRFNLKRGATDIERLTAQALRAHDLVGWHAEFYTDGPILGSLEPVLVKLPALSIDHLGMSRNAQRYILNLVDRGVRVKASGFGRVNLDVAQTLRQIHRVNPEALMFGSDLPGTRARRTFEAADIDLIADCVGDDLDAVLRTNARKFYRLPTEPGPAPGGNRTLEMPAVAAAAGGDTAPLPAVEHE